MAGEHPSSPARLKRKVASSDLSLSPSKRLKSSPSHKLSKSERRRRKHGSSPLERLPLEILVQIFMESMEISLPQSSPYIAQALSSQWVISQYLARVDTLTVPQINRMMRCHFFTHEWLATNSKSFGEAISKDDSRSHHICTLKHAPCANPVVTFPDHLIRSPWTAEKQDLYKALSLRKEKCSPQTSPSHQAILLHGLNDAIAEGSVPAVQMLLLSSHAGSACSSNPRAASPLPHSILRKAVINGGCNPSIVTMLLIHGLHYICDPNRSALAMYYSDAQIWEWAESHGSKGAFLIKMMKLMNDIRYGVWDLPSWLEFRCFFDSQMSTIHRIHIKKLSQEMKDCITSALGDLVDHWVRCRLHSPVQLRDLSDDKTRGDHEGNGYGK